MLALPLPGGQRCWVLRDVIAWIVIGRRRRVARRLIVKGHGFGVAPGKHRHRH